MFKRCFFFRGYEWLLNDLVSVVRACCITSAAGGICVPVETRGTASEHETDLVEVFTVVWKIRCHYLLRARTHTHTHTHVRAHTHTHSSRLFLHCNWTSDWCPSTRNLPENTHQALWSSLKVLYYQKHVFSGLYIYKLVLPEPTNSQDEESKQFLHRLCSPHTGKTALLQAVQIQLLSLRNDRSHLHPFFRICSLISDTDIDCAAGCLRSHQLSSTSTIGERVPQCNLEPYGTLFWKMFV